MRSGCEAFQDVDVVLFGFCHVVSYWLIKSCGKKQVVLLFTMVIKR